MSQFHRIAVPAELIAQACEGDERAQEAIYRAYAGAVYTLARRLVLRPAVAEELLQDTFVEVLRNLRAYRGDGAFGAWVRSIAVSKCLQYLRSPWHRSLLWIDAHADDPEPQVDPTEEAPRPDTVVGAQKDLERALHRLTPIARTVVWLHDVEGYTHEEIASLLGRTRSFSKSQLARAHERLRASLNATEESLSCTPVSTTS